MKEFSSDPTIIRANKILRFHRIKGYRKTVVPLITYLSAIVTTAFAWFHRVGFFKFDPSSWFDWIFSFTLLTLFIYGSFLIITKFVDEINSIVVTRDEVSSLITLARSAANYSFVNISGDLSWLKEDYQHLLKLRKLKPRLRMRIYYDAEDVSEENLNIMEKLTTLGVEFVAYPHLISTRMKCILIDRESFANSKLFEIQKIAVPKTIDPRTSQLRLWRTHINRSSLTYQGVISFMNLLEMARPKPILIGISGINNTGKTKLAVKLYEMLRRRFKTDLVDDLFKQIHEKTSIEANLYILFTQLKQMGRRDIEILIFDETIIDTFCYLCLRLRDISNVTESLAKEVTAAAKDFDIIINVNKSYDKYKEGKHVSSAERTFISGALEKFFQNHRIEKIDLTIDAKHFNESIEENSIQIVRMVTDICKRHSI
jgi:hypothetical protein